jgi:hypothetical protein
MLLALLQSEKALQQGIEIHRLVLLLWKVTAEHQMTSLHAQ